MGISTLPRLPLFAPFNPTPPRLPGLRPQTQITNYPQRNLAHARIFFLAHYAPSSARWTIRTTLLHTAPWQPSRMGNSLATGVEGKERGYGGGGRVVCADWRPEYCASSVAICGSGGEEGKEGDELGSGRVG